MVSGAAPHHECRRKKAILGQVKAKLPLHWQDCLVKVQMHECSRQQAPTYYDSISWQALLTSLVSVDTIASYDTCM